MKKLSHGQTYWLLLIVCCLTLLPFLGLTDYHTKGEPRESVVSYSMLTSGDWVLPRNNGGEMAYKPPFFHWCIAAAASVMGGVTEGVSRLPSAVALIAMTLAGFRFFSRRRGVRLALVASLVSFTSFELHRAGTNCRVDMVLTAATVGALFALYRWWEQDRRGVLPLVTAILLMGIGTLTKGPVGTLIPCLVMGVFLLLRGEPFFRSFFLLFGIGLLSLIPYAAWFLLAWQHGGQEFLDLIYDENIGRMTGTMSYKVHVEPWFYNFLMMLPGLLMWTLLGLIMLFFVRWRRPAWAPRQWWQGLCGWVRTADAVDLFSLTAAVIILVFYSIPECKRSVYIMPAYPFIAWFIARLLVRLDDSRHRALLLFGHILSTVVLLIVVLLAVLQIGPLRASVKALADVPAVAALTSLAWWQWLLLALTAAAALWWFTARREGRPLLRATVLILALYVAVDGVFSPAILNPSKSLKTVSAEIDRIAPASEAPLYEFIEKSLRAQGDPPHFFEVNFYLGNRIGNFYRERPDHGFLLISSDDAEQCLPSFKKEGYRFNLRYETDKRHLQVYAFTRRHEL